MRTATLIGFTILAGGSALAQPAQDSATLPQLMADLEYVQLLNAAQLTSDQLGALLDAQLTWQAEVMPAGDVAAALAEVRQGVLGGATADQAINALGPRQQAVRTAQQRLAESEAALAGQLAAGLTAEQRAALAWNTSPARHLQVAADVVGMTRAVPDQQWEQMRPGITQSIGMVCLQADPGGGATPEGIAALLDEARAMSDQQFATAQPGLARRWAAALMPNLLRQLEDPAAQAQRLDGACRQLLTSERGPELVEAKLDALIQP